MRFLSSIVMLGLASVATSAGPGFFASLDFYGDGAGDEFGYSVSGAGDVNGDGFDDIIVGARFDDDNGADSGSARVISGATGQVLYTFYGDAAGDNFGWSVCGAGDVNGDGFDDLIVGAPGDDDNGANAGSARVFSGANGQILYTFYGAGAGDQLGFSVGGAGDVNGDGFDDLVVGAPFDDQVGAGGGSARVFSGANGLLLYTFFGDAAGDFFGVSVSGAGDVNSDGLDDFIVGASLDDDTGANAGSARVYSGANGQILYTFFGAAAGDNFGSSVSGAGDVNGDGFDDLIVGARFNDDNATDSGSARVLSGATGQILYTFYGDVVGDNLGWSVGGAGDVDGDGFDDLIVGAPGADITGGLSGSARIYSGATGQVLFTFHGDAVGDQLGISVSGAGDVNGDGLDDLIVGTYFDDNNGANSGSARVFFVYAPTTPSQPCPGDINGDGQVTFADLNILLNNYNAVCTTP